MPLARKLLPEGGLKIVLKAFSASPWGGWGIAVNLRVEFEIS